MDENEGTVEDQEELENQIWTEFGGLGLRGLTGEESRIGLELEEMRSRAKALAFDNYRTFIRTAECSKDAARLLDEAHSSCRQLAGPRLAKLREACLAFENRAETFQNRRKSASALLARHTQLLEVLELPQLVETCVRNGHYEEALELRHYTTSKLARSMKKVPKVVAEVEAAVQASSRAMLAQLLSQLRSQSVQLPECLRIVGYIRRMNYFETEAELRLRFLQARDAFITSTLKAVPRNSGDPYEHLTKTMDLARVHIFDVVTQYRALFSSDQDDLSSSVAPNNESNECSSSSSSSSRLLLSSWLNRRIDDFLVTLENDLDGMVDSTGGLMLDSLMGQAMYFGQSFGRVGADFRLSLVPIFYRCVRRSAFQHLKDRDRAFDLQLARLALKMPSNKDDVEDQNRLQRRQREPLEPPLSLMEFPPLAELCNAVLGSLNETRLVAPLALGTEHVAEVQKLLESAAESIARRARRLKEGSKTTTETETMALRRLASKAFCHELVPHLDACLRVVYPRERLALATGDPDFSLGLDVASIFARLPAEFRPETRSSLDVLETVKVEKLPAQDGVPGEADEAHFGPETDGAVPAIMPSIPPSPFVAERSEMLAKEVDES